MLNIHFDQFPTLETERLILRETRLTDAQDFFEMRSNKKTMQYVERPLAQTIDDAVELIEKLDKIYKNHEGVSWTMTLKGFDRFIGNIGIWSFELDNHRTLIGYSLLPDYEGKGYMSETLRAVTLYACNVLGFHTLEARINPDNIRSGKLLERNGFVKEGYLKENYFWNGKYGDTTIYSYINKTNNSTA